ncbi:MAG: hypothetical protein LBG48_02925 [Rickettsiales bacterium]|jgi:hypothetical protein|nr:hypothetical protein [Rickettsiales bacterium]
MENEEKQFESPLPDKMDNDLVYCGIFKNDPVIIARSLVRPSAPFPAFLSEKVAKKQGKPSEERQSELLDNASFEHEMVSLRTERRYSFNPFDRVSENDFDFSFLEDNEECVFEDPQEALDRVLEELDEKCPEKHNDLGI